MRLETTGGIARDDPRELRGRLAVEVETEFPCLLNMIFPCVGSLSSMLRSDPIRPKGGNFSPLIFSSSSNFSVSNSSNTRLLSSFNKYTRAFKMKALDFEQRHMFKVNLWITRCGYTGDSM